LEVVVQLVVERTPQVPDLGVSLNGCWPTFAREETNRLLFPTGIYTRHLDSHRAFNYRFKVSGIREGWNEILVINGSHKRATLAERRENSATLVSVEVAVRPRPAHRSKTKRVSTKENQQAPPVSSFRVVRLLPGDTRGAHRQVQLPR
jgi:hypothetical protein